MAMGLHVRDWIYVEDHCRALDVVLHQGKEGEIYNIGGRSEKTKPCRWQRRFWTIWENPIP